MNIIVELVKSMQEARQREADRVIRRYEDKLLRYRVEATRPARRSNEASWPGSLTQTPFRSKATMRLRHAIAIVAIMLISFGAKMFFFSPPTADAGMHSNTTNLPTTAAHSNALSPQIGEPPYP